jgi:tetratricopeptide (TPR) repeat protein
MLARLACWLLIVPLALFASPAWAENEGQEDLDKAIEAQLSADNLDEISEVIDLCQSALDKGLADQDAEFAHQLLASTLMQRAGAISQAILQGAVGDVRQYIQLHRAAIEDLNRVVEHDSEQTDAYVLLGRLHLLPGGDRKSGVAAMNKALARTTNDPPRQSQMLFLRGGLQDEPAQQLADFDAALALDEANLPARRARGLARFEQGQQEEGLADLDRALEIEPDHGPTLEVKGAALTQLGKLDEALAVLDQALEANPRSASAYAQRGRVKIMKEQAADALIDLDKALLLTPDNPAVLLLRAGAYQMTGDNQKALADVDAILKNNPEQPQALRARALLLAGSGDFAKAIPDLKAAIDAAPQDGQMWLQLGMLYSGLKDTTKAIESFTQAIQAGPPSSLAYQSRGDTYISIGKHQEALADYEAALLLDPNNPGVLNNAAWLLATSTIDELRDGHRALALADQACRVTEHKAPHILSTLGAAYAELGDFENAKKWSAKAIELATDRNREQLAEELASYERKEPIREMQTDGDLGGDDDAPAEDESAAADDLPTRDDLAKEPEKKGPKF